MELPGPFIFRGVLAGGGPAPLPHVSAVLAHAGTGAPRLYAATDHNAVVAAFELREGMAASELARAPVASAPLVGRVTGLAAVTLGEVDVLLPATPFDPWLAVHELGPAGGLAEAWRTGGSGATSARFGAITALGKDGQTIVLASRAGQGGVDAFVLEHGTGLSHLAHVGARPDNHLGSVTAFATASWGERSFVFAASTLDSGVTAFELGPGGVPVELGSLGPAAGLPVSRPAALEFVEIGSAAYLVMAATGSQSLSVLRIDPLGGMLLRDHVLDTRETRFGGTTVLRAVDVDGHVLVFAAGTDGGLTVFDMGWDGRLHLRDVLAGDGLAGFGAVSGLAVARVGSEVQVFVAGSASPGMLQFSYDVSDLAGNPPLPLSGAGDRGGAGVSVGGPVGAKQLLVAGAAGGRITDGPGPDIMIGGPGADVFTLVPDRHLDRILGYQPGIDRIDLSRYPMLYSHDQLVFSRFDFGVLIDVLGDRLLVRGGEGVSLGLQDFPPEAFIF